MYEIVNYTYCAELNCTVDLKFIVNHSIDVMLTKNFPNALQMRVKKTNGHCLIFKKGKVVITGCKSKSDCYKTLRIAARRLQKLGCDVKISNRSVKNIVASYDFGSPIDLDKLYNDVRPHGVYERELFPGLKYNHPSIKPTIIFFQSGKINITGSRCKSDIDTAFVKLFTLLF